MSSMTSKVEKGNVLYLSVVGGNMVEASEEGVEGAVKREYETSDGTKGTKWEILHKNLTGHLTTITFDDSKYGERAILKFQNGEDKAQLSFPTDSKYFADFAKKAPNLDLSKEISINVYDFEPEEGKRLTGVSLKQDGDKVDNYYWDGKKTLHGMPEVSKEERKEYDSDDWKMFFLKVKKFLKKKVQAMKIPEYTPETKNTDTPIKENKKEDTKGINSDTDEDDLPF